MDSSSLLFPRFRDLMPSSSFESFPFASGVKTFLLFGPGLLRSGSGSCSGSSSGSGSSSSGSGVITFLLLLMRSPCSSTSSGSGVSTFLFLVIFFWFFVLRLRIGLFFRHGFYLYSSGCIFCNRFIFIRLTRATLISLAFLFLQNLFICL